MPGMRDRQPSAGRWEIRTPVRKFLPLPAPCREDNVWHGPVAASTRNNSRSSLTRPEQESLIRSPQEKIRIERIIRKSIRAGSSICFRGSQ